jgi:hypothetical protein
MQQKFRLLGRSAVLPQVDSSRELTAFVEHVFGLEMKPVDVFQA